MITDHEAADIDRANASGKTPVVFVHGLWLLPSSWDRWRTVPWAIAKASYRKQLRNDAVTEIVEMPGRGHSLTIDHGWREVADTALGFVRRFAAP
jgi:pimeloyl-ACP methyl ester carboxylesterase